MRDVAFIGVEEDGIVVVIFVVVDVVAGDGGAVDGGCGGGGEDVVVVRCRRGEGCVCCGERQRWLIGFFGYCVE